MTRWRGDHDDTGDATDPEDRSIRALTDHLTWLTDKLTALETQLAELRGPSTEEHQAADDRPAAWVLYTPPAAAEDTAHRPDEHTPLWTVRNFVAWYNTVYIGQAGTPARAIPDCWEHHPGLAAETGTLAYAWRQANIGPTADPIDAQYWHHTWRPGFSERLDLWLQTHCHHGEHAEPIPPPRPMRYPTE